MKVVVNGGFEIVVRIVTGRKYKDERQYPPCYLKTDIKGFPTCFGEFTEGGEFKLVRGFNGEILAVTI